MILFGIFLFMFTCIIYVINCDSPLHSFVDVPYCYGYCYPNIILSGNDEIYPIKSKIDSICPTEVGIWESEYNINIDIKNPNSGLFIYFNFEFNNDLAILIDNNGDLQISSDLVLSITNPKLLSDIITYSSETPIDPEYGTFTLNIKLIVNFIQDKTSVILKRGTCTQTSNIEIQRKIGNPYEKVLLLLAADSARDYGEQYSVISIQQTSTSCLNKLKRVSCGQTQLITPDVNAPMNSSTLELDINEFNTAIRISVILPPAGPSITSIKISGNNVNRLISLSTAQLIINGLHKGRYFISVVFDGPQCFFVFIKD